MNAKTEIPRNTKALDAIATIERFNPLYSQDYQLTALNVQSVLCFLYDYITDEENPGISEERHPGAALILECAIKALDAQLEFGHLTAPLTKEA